MAVDSQRQWMTVQWQRGVLPPHERYASYGRINLAQPLANLSPTVVVAGELDDRDMTAADGSSTRAAAHQLRWKEIESMAWTMEINGTTLTAARSPWSTATPALVATASASCAKSEVIGWPRVACIASTVGASTLPCPSSLRQMWSARSTKLGFPAATVAAMGCRADGTYEFTSYVRLVGAGEEDGGGDEPASRYLHRAEFNRSAAFGIGRRRCERFQWAHAKGKRLIHAGPAILGADKVPICPCDLIGSTKLLRRFCMCRHAAKPFRADAIAPHDAGPLYHMTAGQLHCMMLDV